MFDDIYYSNDRNPYNVIREKNIIYAFAHVPRAAYGINNDNIYNSLYEY